MRWARSKKVMLVSDLCSFWGPRGGSLRFGFCVLWVRRGLRAGSGRVGNNRYWSYVLIEASELVNSLAAALYIMNADWISGTVDCWYLWLAVRKDNASPLLSNQLIQFKKLCELGKWVTSVWILRIPATENPDFCICCCQGSYRACNNLGWKSMFISWPLQLKVGLD